MNSNLFFILLTVGIYVGLISCKKDRHGKCLKSTGSIIAEERTSDNFTTIEIKDHINLIIRQDSFYSIKAEAGSNLLPYINTIVKKDTLWISNDNRCDWLRSYKHDINIYISVVDLKEIICRGSGNITSKDTLKLDVIKVEQIENNNSVSLIIEAQVSRFSTYSGFGDYHISGKSKYNRLYTLGYGKFDCSQLDTEQTVVKHKGTGDFFVTASNTLDVTIEYAGYVYYTGNPTTIITNITGTGKLIKL